MTSPDDTYVDVRCPVGPRELLGQALQRGPAPEMVDNSMLMSLHCRWCSRTARKSDPSVVRVTHLVNFLGDIVDSITVNR